MRDSKRGERIRYDVLLKSQGRRHRGRGDLTRKRKRDLSRTPKWLVLNHQRAGRGT